MYSSSFTATCHAQSGVVIEKVSSNLQDIDHPNISDVQDFPGVLKSGFDTAWSRNLAQINEMIQGIVAYGNDNHFFPNGYTLYNQKSLVGSSGTLSPTIAGQNLVLNYIVTNNYLEFTTTVPENKLGKDFDPRFSFTYDMTLKITIPISSAAQGLQVSSAIAAVSNVSKPDSHNFTGDQVLEAAWIVKLFQGPDFAGQLGAGFNNRTFPITSQIQQMFGQINTPLQQLSQQGYTGLSGRIEGSASPAIEKRVAPPAATKQNVIVRITDSALVDPKNRSLIHSYAKVKFFNAQYTQDSSGRNSTFARTMLADVRTVPIHVDIVRDVRDLLGAKCASAEPSALGVNVPASGRDKIAGFFL